MTYEANKRLSPTVPPTKEHLPTESHEEGLNQAIYIMG